MATVHIALTGVYQQQSAGDRMPVPDSVPSGGAELLTPSGSSQVGTLVAPGSGSDKLFWVVTANGGNVGLVFGPGTPVVTAGDPDWLVLNGQTREFSAQGGQKAAYITVA